MIRPRRYRRYTQKPRRPRSHGPARVLYAVINEVFRSCNRNRRLANTDGEDFTLRLYRIIRFTPFQFDFAGLPFPHILRKSVVYLHSETGKMIWVHHSNSGNNSTLKDLLWLAHFTNDYWCPALNIGYPAVPTYPIYIFKHSYTITKKNAEERLHKLLDQCMKKDLSRNISKTISSYIC